MAKTTYFVSGMHCAACELNIERIVRKIKGVKKVDVSLEKSQIIITADTSKSIPSAHKLNALLNKYGYEFSQKSIASKTTNLPQNYLIVGLAFIAFIIFFLTVGGSEFITGTYINLKSNAASFFLFGIAAGISSCAALVGGLILTMQNDGINQGKAENKNRYLPFILFNLARLVTFALLGGVLGLLGSAFNLSLVGSAFLTIIISIFMVVIGLQMLGFEPLKNIAINPFGKIYTDGLNRSNSQSFYFPIILGAITFFIPCGYTIIAQTQALGSGDFWLGFTSLGSFALGTFPILALISFSSVKFHSNPRFSTAYRMFSGLMIVFFAFFTINSQLGLLGFPSLAVINFKPPQNSVEVDLAPELLVNPTEPNANPEFQIMQMEVKGFEYFPKVINLKSGLPTRFEITDNGSIGCARAVYARGIYAEIINLQPGLNAVEFMSPAPGNYQISCSMWMVEPITVIIE